MNPAAVLPIFVGTLVEATVKIHLKPISDQTIVITGASSGIGLCTARMAARRGAKVILIARNEDALKKIVTEITAEGGEAAYYVADVGDRDRIAEVAQKIIGDHGGFDTWVNNAGVGIYAPLEETSEEDHRKIFETNYWGVVHGSIEALKHLKTRGGAIINTGSIASDMPTPILSAYAASKHAVKGFTDSLRLELMHEGAPVSVTLIKPSGIHTPFGQHAKNYMTARSKVPPPVYHPDLVAKSILHAAAHPTRDVLVGEAGMVQTLMARVVPGLADHVFSWAFYETALDHDQERRRSRKGLHQSASNAEETGDQDDMIFRTSPYTEAQLHKGATVAVALGVAAFAAAALANSGRIAGRSRRKRWT